MFIEERLEKIIELLEQQKRVTVEEAADLCQVSFDTIRRDFKRLVERGQVTRTHGGILAKEDFVYDSSTVERKTRATIAAVRCGGCPGRAGCRPGRSRPAAC